MDEFALIERFFASRAAVSAQNREDVRVGIGDDAAVTRVDSGSELVIATDTLVEGTHFPAGTPAHALGHRCLAVNLSDIASMGAEPLWCTLALTLPQGSADWVDEFSAGFMALANAQEIALIGGDTTRGPLSVTVTIHGRVAPGAAVLRDGAAPREGVYVTGRVGAAAAGLALLQSASAAKPVARDDLARRFLYPVPRTDAGRALSGVASAMIDLSDGLHVDLARLLRASGVGARLSIESLPLDADALEHFGRARAIDFALSGGDDYELCFTVPAAAEEGLRRAAATWSCEISRIGETISGDDIIWLEHGRVIDVSDTSFRHFAEESP
ncbi:MAG: thiamine-phosphate kinase [Gammaproteobacteria bacterium]|nr:thiamine-phosphate kinase [Gammaproteobacteria bacterium]NND36692.1 thiamine-phosphate kinase [Gammaproteobacteria bacterium]